MSLDDLIARAQELKATGAHDNQLADQLAVALNVQYGVNDRSPEFLKAVQLSSSIREIKKYEWKKDIQVLETGSIPAVQEEGYFYISQYGVGKVDLLKDGQRVHRMYGVLLKIDLEEGTLKPWIMLDNNFNDDRNNKAKFRRGKELFAQIEGRMGIHNKDSVCGVLLETYANDDFQVNEELFDEHGLSFGMAVQQGSYAQFFAHNVEVISQRIAMSDQHIRQVGRVVDGGRRYKR